MKVEVANIRYLGYLSQIIAVYVYQGPYIPSDLQEVWQHCYGK